MKEPLIATKTKSFSFCNKLLWAFAVFFVFTLYKQTQSTSAELPVGVIKSGSHVRLRRQIDDFPPGFVGKVSLVTGRMVEITAGPFTFVAPFDAVAELSLATSSAEELTDAFSSMSTNTGPIFPLPHSQPSGSSEFEWFFWPHIKQDPWYLERKCAISDCVGDHKCSEGYVTFHRRLVPKFRDSHKLITETFQKQADEFEPAKERFLEYATKLLDNPRERLILVSVMPDHTFLIEQHGGMFRIYQSWAYSFDLQYWTDLNVPTSTICEPGKKVKEALKDPQEAPALAQAGIQDDKAAIELARRQHGGLKVLRKSTISMLLQAVSNGFILEEMRRQSADSIFPASRSLSGGANTKPYLGKNVIDLIQLSKAQVPFSIEVSFIEDSFEDNTAFYEELNGPVYRGNTAPQRTFRSFSQQYSWKKKASQLSDAEH